MRIRRPQAGSRSNATGTVLVLVALAFPVLLGFSGLVIDVGNWFEHRRHLQVQADAGALAAAGDFRIPCDDNPILATATSYSGVDFNPQVGGTDQSDVLRAFNSKSWPGGSPRSDPSTVEGAPCDTKMIDVKLVEKDLPWFLRAAQVPFIHAQARVEIRRQEQASGTLPIGVPEVDPQKARVEFVDEVSGDVVATAPLTRTGSSGGLAQWSNASAPVSVPIQTPHVGVRIALSGGASTSCGAALVNCYDAGSADGLVHIRGFATTPDGTRKAPVARGVNLVDGNCGDGYFSARPSACTIGMTAEIDFGNAPKANIRLKVTRNDSNVDYPMSFDTATGRWVAPPTIGIGAAAGPVSFSLDWSTGCPANGKGKCDETGTFANVQRTFAASPDRSGPLKSVRVLENGVLGANSFPRCADCPRSLVVAIGIKGTLANATSVNDPPTVLKVAGGGNYNQALDCDPDLPNLREELSGGCGPDYVENTGTSCPANASALWSTPQPWECVAISTGATTNQVPAGLNLRILGDEQASTCTAPNNWADFPDIPKGDPRIVELFLTPFGAFSGSGAGTVPVTGFATFYVTGWGGGGEGFGNPCAGQGDDTVGAGSIVGHFIKYIDTLNDGGAGKELCDFDGFGRCVAVLTR